MRFRKISSQKFDPTGEFFHDSAIQMQAFIAFAAQKFGINENTVYLSSINLNTNCPAALILGLSSISKLHDSLARRPSKSRVLNNIFLFELSAQTGFHCRPCHWLICRRGIIHHKDNSLAVGGILCHPLLSLPDVSQSFLA